MSDLLGGLCRAQTGDKGRWAQPAPNTLCWNSVLQALLWASFSYYGRMRSHQLEL